MPAAVSEMMIAQDDLSQVFFDVTPIPQDDGPNPVCAIDYSPPFIQAYDYMRAVLKSSEMSDRALRLTGLCLKLNPANYTIWHFRRQCLEQIMQESEVNRTQLIRDDLHLAETLGGANPKNYQIWYHRRALLERAATVSPEGMTDAVVTQELAYVAKVLDEDSKNYHAWSHRQWIMRTANKADLWERELEFAHTLIQRDPRNNSAWNQRWFVCHAGGSIQLLSLEIAKKEGDYAVQGASLDPYNESPWRYLIGILKEQCQALKDDATRASLLDRFESKASQQRENIEAAGKNPDGCFNLTSALIDILELKGDTESLEKAVQLASALAKEHDPIRKKYWLLRVEEMKQYSQVGKSLDFSPVPRVARVI